MPKDIRLDSFGGGLSEVDQKKYIVVTTQDTLLTGQWSRAAATLQGFPSSGRWIYVPDAGGVMLQGEDGKLLCTLQGLMPGSLDKEGDVDIVLTPLLPFAFAKWNLQD
jgi:hypothetical protein